MISHAKHRDLFFYSGLLQYNTYPALAQAATKGPPLKEVVGVIPATTMGGLPVNAVNFVTNSP
jgi:hypothetical protein